MKTKNIFSLAAVFFFLVLCGFQLSQNPAFLEKLKASLEKYNAEYPQEKIYLQFDKPFYKPGEDIWFNAFVLNSNTHKPVPMSDVLYVDLADPKGNIVSHLELFVNEGTSRGDFRIPADNMGGIYNVRAYTNWMKNFPDEQGFRKEIQVQRVITPRLLLKLDFEKEAYGEGDEVVVTLTARNLKNEPLHNAEVAYTAFINGRRLSADKATTDEKGNLMVRFTLPKELTTNDGLAQLVVNWNGIQESISRSIPIVLNNISLSFFPEGGNLIEGAESRVAFKALNEHQKAADVTGNIEDERGNTVTTFSSFHMGMGSFNLTPVAGHKYFARIKSPATRADRVALPAAQPSGYALRLTGRNDTELKFAVYSPVTGTAWLAGQSHGNLYHTAAVELRKGDNEVTINTEKFPAGIAVFTLFRESGQGLCERLVYLNADRLLNIDIQTEKTRYAPGEEVKVRISTTDPKGKPVQAKLSLAVADDQLITFADDKQDNLLSSMLLSSEVKGEVQEPSFYFDPNEAKAKEALDYLLLTQGWRRFQWSEVLQPKIALTYNAEKIKTISGSITDKNGKPVEDEVTLVELGNLRRVIKVRTANNGQFSFRNTDPTIPVMLLTSTGTNFVVDYNEKELQEYRRQNQDLRAKRDKEVQMNIAMAPVPEENEIASEQEVIAKEEVLAAGNIDMAMDADVQSLSEVVVVGYAAERKNDLTASVTTINADELGNMLPLGALENRLQGRVAGVVVQPNSGNPGSSPQIRIRGVSSLSAGGSEPLYIIDGHPIGTSINYNFSNSSMLTAEDIASIEVYHSPEATALFGSAAINGAIVIKTKSGFRYGNTRVKPMKEKFASVILQPREFSAGREYYVDSQPASKERNDFRTTVYWNPEVITNDKGIATITFRNTDAVSAFRVTAEGVTASGLIGHSEHVYSTILPVSADAKLPAYLGFEDVLTVPVRVANETDATFTAKVTLSIPKDLATQQPLTQEITVKPNRTETVSYTLRPTATQGTFPVKISVAAAGHTDEITQNIRVTPVGFPMRASFSGRELERNVRFRISDAEKGTLKAELSAFPDVLSDLFTGAEGIFREPYGCFEQTSSSTFPNILALQYLQRSGLVQPATQQLALGYIKRGYERLVSYEVKGGGFEWFGHAPAHEGLTAYGLIEFIEMKKVYPGVNDKMIERTKDWLLSRRKGDGTFNLHSHGLDDFSRPSGDVSNAYITYALSETGTTGLEKEYRHNMQSIKGDMYRMALMANVAHNLGEKEDYNRMMYLFETKIAPAGLDQMSANHSVVWSQGLSLTNETVALWALALMKEGRSKLDLASKCVNFLVSRRSGGMFGSTQATVLSLKALSEYALLARSTAHGGEIQVFVNQVLAETMPYKENTRDKIQMNGFGASLDANGEQKLRIAFNNTPEALPYSVNVYWHSKTPASNEDCKVRIETALTASTVRLNETVRMNASVTNSSAQGLPMTMAVIGIPAGLAAQPWQLKELQDKKVFDFYEINDNYLYIYYRQMKPKERKQILLDLKAEIPGHFTGSASSAYLYYTNEYKDWAKGITVDILQ